jgi:hypothetical protein
MFSSAPAYERVKRSGALNAERFAEIYDVPLKHVEAFECDQALAFKFSIPRPCVQGDFGDGDLHGGQQYAPLLDIEIPVA